MAIRITESRTIDCPGCANAVVISGVHAGELLLCAACRSPILLSAESSAANQPASGPAFDVAKTKTVTTSRKAIASAVLGMSSLLVSILTGIPAIVLGILALRDIHRAGGRYNGTVLAITGIASGVLFGLLCTPFLAVVVIASVLTARSMHEFNTPGEITALAERIGTDRVPRDLVGIYGFESRVLRLRTAVFLDDLRNPDAILVLMLAPAAWNQQPVREQMEQWASRRNLHFTVQETRALRLEEGGPPWDVTEQLGADPVSGRPRRRYLAFLEKGNGAELLGVLVLTGAADATDMEPEQLEFTISEREVRELLQSLAR